MMRNTVNIRKALPADLPGMMSILRACAKDMLAHGIDQWDQTFPPEDFVIRDIGRGSANVGEIDGSLCGMFTMDENQSPEYSQVSWQIPASRIAVIHRLAVSPDYHRMGVASQLMDYAESQAAKSGFDVMRLDSFSCNYRSVEMYLTRGYRKTGFVHFRNKPEPFFCFEKPLRPANS
jgi:ribosomal protein S18 acetylase RimI-like enzyme